MKIIKRHKNSSGVVVGYTVSINNNIKYLNSNVVIQMFNEVTNATLLSNGEFRANKGEIIETVVDNRCLMVNKQVNKLTSVKGNDSNVNYYGKEFINVCRRVRKYAISNSLLIDKTSHKSNNGANIHLFRLIEACDISLESFIRGYLSVIQPYSLSRFQKSKDLDKSNTWLCDTGYGVSLVIKINEADKEKPIVVSFHESNLRGSFSAGRSSFSDKLCAVLVDTVNECQPNVFNVDYTIQRGFIRYRVNSITSYYKNGVALVKYDKIQDTFNELLNKTFEGIVSTYKDENIEDAPPVLLGNKDFKNISFMSMGYNVVNNVCLLLDLFSQYTDKGSRALLAEMTNNIVCEMPDFRRDELKSALSDRFNGSSNKLYLAIKDL